MGGIALVPEFKLSQKKQVQKRIKGRVPVVLKGAGVVKSASHWSPSHLARTAKKMQKNDVRNSVTGRKYAMESALYSNLRLFVWEPFDPRIIQTACRIC